MALVITADDLLNLGPNILLGLILLAVVWDRTSIPGFASTERRGLMDAINSCRRGILRTLYAVKLWRKEIISRALRGTASAAPRLPDFVVIGAQRAGTTSLWENVGRHPGIRLPARKELHFFDLNFHRGAPWYMAQFRNCVTSEGKVLVGDASPYYMFHPHVASRCSALLPHVRIIVILRNPVDRAYSHYNHEVRSRQERLSFEDALEAEPVRMDGELARMSIDETYHSFAHAHYSYMARGVYVDQLLAWRQRFSCEQILLVCSEEFFEDPAKQYQRVLQFLGLRPIPLKKFSDKNKGKYPKMLPSTRERLVAHFAPHNRRLYAFLNESWPAGELPDFARYWDR